MNSSKLYKIYNQVFKTSLDLSSLALHPSNDVAESNSIKIEISNKKLDKKYLDNQFNIEKDYGYYNRNGVGFFEFYEGNRIVISNISTINNNFYHSLLNFPMACLMQQRGYMPLHASVISYKDNVIMFPGISRSGKSSLAALLLSKGAKLITEDIAVIYFLDSTPVALPSYPLIKISSEIAKILNLSDRFVSKLDKNNSDRDVFSMHDSFCNKPKEIDYLIFPKWVKKNKNVLIKKNSSESMREVLSSNLFIPSSKISDNKFMKKNTQLVRNTKIFEYQRDMDFQKLLNFEELLQTELS